MSSFTVPSEFSAAAKDKGLEGLP